jgi:hypothetical protein
MVDAGPARTTAVSAAIPTKTILNINTKKANPLIVIFITMFFPSDYIQLLSSSTRQPCCKNAV